MRACFYIIVLLALLIQTQAQTSIIPEKLTIEDGLAQGFISTIHQDREGFLWLGTKNGLNRYDGRQFEVFTHNIDDPYSISNDWATSMVEEGDFLVIGTRGTHLNLFHKQTKKFYRIPLDVEGIESFSEVNTVVKDKTGQYWINTAKAQVLKVTFPDQFWENLPIQEALLGEVKVDLVLKDHYYENFSNDGNFLVVYNGKTHEQLNIHTLVTSAFSVDQADTNDPAFETSPPNLMLKMYLSAPYDRFNPYRLEDGKWKQIPADFFFKANAYYDAAAGLVWLQRYSDNVLLAFELNALLTTEQVTEKQAAYIIKNVDTTIRHFYKDRSGILWVGTAGVGVLKISPRKLVVKNYFTGLPIGDVIPFIDDEFLLSSNRLIPLSMDNPTVATIKAWIEGAAFYKFSWMRESGQQWLGIIRLVTFLSHSLSVFYILNNTLITFLFVVLVEKRLLA
ncbi:MAG: two-component regulator propeller domain-containing protein [Bacteroidota bacterium]